MFKKKTSKKFFAVKKAYLGALLLTYINQFWTYNIFEGLKKDQY